MSLRAVRTDHATAAKPTFAWDDPFLLEEQLGEDERLIRDTRASTPRSG